MYRGNLVHPTVSGRERPVLCVKTLICFLRTVLRMRSLQGGHRVSPKREERVVSYRTNYRGAEPAAHRTCRRTAVLRRPTEERVSRVGESRA